MNKKILKQALLFKNSQPNFSAIKALCDIASTYQNENGYSFIYARRREKASITNEALFFEFLRETQSVNVKNFNELEHLISPKSRAEAIEFSGDSKHKYIKVFDNTLLVSLEGGLNTLYTQEDLAGLKEIENFVAVENGETFLKMRNYQQHFKTQNFIYLAGYANTLTRLFLKDKSVEFFLDFDIEALKIYNSFECKSKTFHMPKNLDYFFKSKDLNNVELYQKQRHRLKDSYPDALKELFTLITTYNTVVEQEIIYETP